MFAANVVAGAMYISCLATDYDGTPAHDGVVEEAALDALTFTGSVTPASACWIWAGAVAEGHEQNQLRRISVPARGHTSGDVAYLRFTLSFRDVEDLLAERGIAVSLTRRTAAG